MVKHFKTTYVLLDSVMIHVAANNQFLNQLSLVYKSAENGDEGAWQFLKSKVTSQSFSFCPTSNLKPNNIHLIIDAETII